MDTAILVISGLAVAVLVSPGALVSLLFIREKPYSEQIKGPITPSPKVGHQVYQR